jgi:hypothetical protein
MKSTYFAINEISPAPPEPGSPATFLSIPMCCEILLQFTIALVYALSFQLATKIRDTLTKQKSYKTLFKTSFIVLKNIAFLLVLFAQLCGHGLQIRDRKIHF